MKSKIRMAAVLVVSVMLSACNPGEHFEGAYCISNTTIIDPLMGERPDMTVVIQGNRITHVFASGEKKLSPENTIIPGDGKFVIPGLWDAHVHFAYLEALAPRMLDLFLCHGITSVRDIGGKTEFVDKWRKQAAADPMDAPRVMMAGPLLDGMPNVYDGSTAQTPELSVGLVSVEDVRKKVMELIEDHKVDLLKAYEMLTPDQFAEVLRLGKQHGLKVTGHVPLSMDVIQASNLGLNSMEHLRNLEISCAENSDELLSQRHDLLAAGRSDPGSILRSRIHSAQREHALERFSEDRADEVLDVLKKNQTWQIPTLALGTASVRRPFESPDFQESFRWIAPEMEQRWKAGIAEFAAQTPSDFQRRYAQWMFDMVARIHKKGIGIMAGTDCPIFFLTPGLSLHEELAMLVHAGLPILEVIKTATINPATYFGMEDELGNVQPGMFADLLILDANPLQDISNTRKINAVIRDGKLHTRTMLDEKLRRLDSSSD